MFDETFRELRRWNQGVGIRVHIPPDGEGYLDRQCPASGCGALFKVLLEDWKCRVPDERVLCPICRHAAPANAWKTNAQLLYAKRLGMERFRRAASDALQRDARCFNTRHRGQLFRLSMSVQPHVPRLVLPPNAAETMEQRFTCETCACRYAALGAAFFCPACGHNSAASMFERTVEIVRNTVAAAPTFKDSLAAIAGKDAAHDAVRQILEDQFSRLVGAFERLAEALFERLPKPAEFKRSRNMFQKLAESSALWRATTGKGYEDVLVPAELAELTRFFQQRHILTHRQGLVDQQYLDRSGDHAHATGQRLVIRGSAVLRLAELVEKLAAGLRATSHSSSARLPGQHRDHNYLSTPP